MNAALARRILERIKGLGVGELVVCPGGRNAPWVELLASEDLGFKVTWFFEERAASFFALGRIRSSHRPVAVITTSGTAVGELLPATMEAFYSGAPMVLLTADRPRRFRGSGAPQATEQVGIFGAFCPQSFDVEGDEELAALSVDRTPVHVNVCFEDPNGGEGAGSIDGGAQRPVQEPKSALENFLSAVEHPLVIVGQLAEDERPAVLEFLLRLGAPFYAEGPSGLRESSQLAHLQIHVGDRLFARAVALGIPFDGVLRIGGVPTHRMWRDLEDRWVDLPVVTVSRLPFSGLGRSSVLAWGDVASILSGVSRRVEPHCALWDGDQRIRDRLVALLDEERSSEPGLFREVSGRLGAGSKVFIGNSLPIREWDLAATWEERGLRVEASRGLNGIDGQLSTFLGQCEPGAENWAILGDLTALYDLVGPWPLPQLDPELRATLVIVNNGGGRIFERMFGRVEFQNEHSISFESWAALWKLPYRCATKLDDLTPPGPGLNIVELRPDEAATARFWARYEDLLA